MQYKKITTLLTGFLVAFCALLAPLHAQQDQQRRLLDYCQRIIEQNQYEKARKVLHEILATDGDNIEAHILLARAFEEEGKFDQAKDYLLRALKIEPDTPQACHALIRVVGLAEGLDAAQALQKRDTWSAACNLAGIEGLAEVSCEARRYDLFETYVQELLQSQPENPRFQEMKMESLIYNGKAKEAHETMVTLVRNVLSSDRPAEDKTKEIKRLQSRFSDTRAKTEKQNKQGGASLPPPSFRPLKTQIAQQQKKVDQGRNRRPRQARTPRQSPSRQESSKPVSAETNNEIRKLQQLGDDALNKGRVMLALSYHLRASRLQEDGNILMRSTQNLISRGQTQGAELFLEALLNHFPAEQYLPRLIERLVDRQARVGNYHNAAFEPEQWHYYRKAADAYRRIAKSDAPLQDRLMAEINALRYEYKPQPYNKRTAAEVIRKLENIAERDGADESVKQEVKRAIQRIELNWIDPLERQEQRRNETIPGADNK